MKVARLIYFLLKCGHLTNPTYSAFTLIRLEIVVSGDSPGL